MQCQATKLIFHRSLALYKSSQTCPSNLVKHNMFHKSANCCLIFLGFNKLLWQTIFVKIILSITFSVPMLSEILELHNHIYPSAKT